MEQFKESPNNWEAQADSIHSIVIVDGKHNEIATIYAQNEEHLLTELQWDNARLITAAPDLLDALIQMTEHLDRIKQYLNDVYFIGLAKKAIDKALK